eukprot:Gb_17123 [translate_table: standard]
MDKKSFQWYQGVRQKRVVGFPYLWENLVINFTTQYDNVREQDNFSQLIKEGDDDTYEAEEKIETEMATNDHQVEEDDNLTIVSIHVLVELVVPQTLHISEFLWRITRKIRKRN